MSAACVRAGLAYFGLVFGAGFVLGAVRVPFVVPRLGERVAELVEMPIVFVVIVAAAKFVTRRFAVEPSASARLATGLIALGLLLAAELLLTLAVSERSLADYVASRDPVSGSVYLAMLVLFAVMPLLVGPSNSSSRRGR